MKPKRRQYKPPWYGKAKFLRRYKLSYAKIRWVLGIPETVHTVMYHLDPKYRRRKILECRERRRRIKHAQRREASTAVARKSSGTTCEEALL
jgi:hypothetical protein